MKHLVTGGSGFLGNLVVRRLLEKGEEVSILDVWEDPDRPRKAKFFLCDIRNRQGVAEAMKGVDVVHHNVALVPLTKSGKNFWDVNVHGSEIAAQEAAKAGVKSFIHMSSSAVYGLPQEAPITEKTPTRPIEIYGKAKLEGETRVRNICEDKNLPLVVIRPRTILGDGRLGIFQILFDWIYHGLNVYVIGSGDIRFQFIHAHDLMDAYMTILKEEKTGIFNVGTDTFGTLRKDLEDLIAYAGTESKVISFPKNVSIFALACADKLGLSPLAPWHYLTYHKEFFFDVERIKSFGWQPKYSNKRILQESYQWFFENYKQASKEEYQSPHRKKVHARLLSLNKVLHKFQK